MEKIVVHKIRIEKAHERVQFQIPMPRDLKRLIGIMTTADVLSNFIQLYHAGAISLWIPDKRDVFFSELVRGQAFEHGVISYDLRFNPDRFVPVLWLDGTRMEFLSIEVGKECRFIEGYYENLAANDLAYGVSIYLKIEV